MSHEHANNELNKADGKAAKKRDYAAPQLVRYGAVRDLTQAGTGATNESAGKFPICNQPTRKGSCPPSERRVKENIVRVGSHPLGFGLYLFDYRPEHRGQWGEGRQFGVMIDEVEPAMPEAVTLHADGYKRVDYGMLGISRAVH